MEQSAVRTRSGIKRVVAGTLVAGLLYVVAPRAGAGLAVPIADADVVASATGTVLHAGLIEAAGSKLVDAEVAFTGAAYDSTGFAAATFNEMHRRLAPAAVRKLAYGRGVGIEAGLAATPEKANQVLLAGLAEIAAPLGGVIKKQVGPLDLDPLAWANLLRGQAAAADVPSDECVIGSDMSSSVAYVADAQLLATGATSSNAKAASARPASSSPAAPVRKVVDEVRSTASGLTGRLGRLAPAPVAKVLGAPKATAPTGATAASAPAASAPAAAEGLLGPVVAIDAGGPARAVSQSTSRTVMVPQRGRDGQRLGDDFGVMSEVRETIAPVTLFKDTPSQLTLEFLGEWVLRTVATGLPGGAYVHYGPGSVSPSTPVIRMLDSSGVTNVLTLQDLLGNKGLVITIPGIAEIAIGEDARAIGGSADSAPKVASNGASAAAAVDVVRVRILPGAPAQLTDLRIGHMEAASSVPAGGVSCPLHVTKTPDASKVDVGDTFDVVMVVTNPYDCTVRDVVLTDEIATKQDAKFAALAATPRVAGVPSAPDRTTGKITWNIGTLAPHASRKVSAVFKALGGAGVITDEATASGTVGACAQQGGTVSGVGVAAAGTKLTGVSPQVDVHVLSGDVHVLGSRSSRVFPLTGAPIAKLVLIALSLIAAGGAALTLAYRHR